MIRPLRAVLPFLLLLGSANSEDSTLASLHNATHDLPPNGSVAVTVPHRPVKPNARTLGTSTHGSAAAKALFIAGDPVTAERLASVALRLQPQDAEALFARMESAAMRADRDTVIETALRLCELAGAPSPDPRVQLAAARLSELGSNTPAFRKAIPRLQALLQNSGERWPVLSSALLNAAMDGVPSMQPEVLSRGAGILTDWRIVGPLSRRGPSELDPKLLSNASPLTLQQYGNRSVEQFQFIDGRITLPGYMLQHGTVYAASQFALLEPGSWTVRLESDSSAELYLDGRLALRTELAQPDGYVSLQLDPGPHRVLLKFASHEGWWRVSANPSMSLVEASGHPESAVETAYLQAAGLYARGDWQAAIETTRNAANPNAATLLFLRAQAQSRQVGSADEAVSTWQQLILQLPGALAAEEALSLHAAAQGNRTEATLRANRVLSSQPDSESALQVLSQFGTPDHSGHALQRRIQLHPSCSVLLEAHQRYAAEHDSAAMALSDIALNGCAPTSLTYARVLADAGMHAAAAEALREVLSASPSDRSAMAMLIRELQLSGDDAGAQATAADWVSVAPNAGTYRRLAAAFGQTGSSGQDTSDVVPFYAPYQRSLAEIIRLSSSTSDNGALLEDHVAIARPDGSVSLYVHRATRILGSNMADQFRRTSDSPTEQVVSLHLLKPDGTTKDLRNQKDAWNHIADGDVIDQESILNFAGDGGIGEHPEVFQYVFAPSTAQVLKARFVVLTPAYESDSGIVIATGNAPVMQSRVSGGMLSRVWESSSPTAGRNSAILPATSVDSQDTFAVVRIVEKDNGWTIPRNAERRRRIETIHPGPRLSDS